MAIEALLALLALILFFVFKILGNKSTSKLPPGPLKLPIIGNMNQLLGSTPPHLVLRDLAKKHGPLIHLQLGQVGAIVVSSSEMSREIMKTHDLVFSSRPKVLSAEVLGYGYTDIGFAPYGAYWRQMRKICILELLSAARVMSFRSAREDEVALLVSSIAASSPSLVNMTQKLFALGHDVTSRIAFGKKNPDPKRFREIAKEGVALAGGFDIADFFPSYPFVRAISGMKSRLERVFLEFDRIVDDIIDNHMEKGEDEPTEHEDLVDVLLRVQRNKDLEMPLSKDNIKAVVLDMFFGGSETTSIGLEWAMVEMMRNPEVMVKARAEIAKAMDGRTKMEENDTSQLTYIKAVINETLRLHPPLPLLIPRESTDRCTIEGYVIPANTRVIINNWAISRDPRHWERADTFYPERFSNSELNFKGPQNYDYLPFGGGRRGCPGIMFAMNVMEYTLANLLYYFEWKLPEGVKAEDLEVSEIFGVTVTRESNLNLIPIPRFKSSIIGVSDGTSIDD